MPFISDFAFYTILTLGHWVIPQHIGYPSNQLWSENPSTDEGVRGSDRSYPLSSSGIFRRVWLATPTRGGVAEASPTQFIDQFRETVRLRFQVGINGLPGRFRGAVDLFRAHAIGEFLVVTHPIEGPPLHVYAVFPACRLLPLPFIVFVGEIEFLFRIGGMLIDLRCGNISPQPIQEPFLVHRHELEKNLPILLRIFGSRQEQPQYGRPDKDKVLVAPPFAKAREGLAVVGLPLLVAFLGELADGKQSFDKG